MDITLHGKILEGEFTSSYYKNAIFKYTIHIPPAVDGYQYALLVSHDGMNQEEAAALEALAATGEAPHTITLGIYPACLPASIPQGFPRELRMHLYDIYSPQYPDFVIQELLPYLTQLHQLSIHPSPDMHMASGGSSGGISAWNMAWHRPDFFHRVYMSSPSFLSMSQGDELVNLIRKYEPKPIRVFVDFSENEPDDYFGSSYCVADASVRALRFAGYDMMDRFYPGEGHCSRYHHFESALDRMRFLWKDWETTPITVSNLSPRAKKLLLPGKEWESTNLPLPHKLPTISNGTFTAPGSYAPKKTTITFTNEKGKTRRVAHNLSDCCALAFSADKWRLYAADRARGCIYAYTVLPDGNLDGKYIHGVLHKAVDFQTPGATALCVDRDDRLYAATEIGIQTIRSCGLIDVIFSLPQGRPVQDLSIGEDGYLYAETDYGVFRRQLNCVHHTSFAETTEPQTPSYYS